jgi:DNA-binding response OmpR family regulator
MASDRIPSVLVVEDDRSTLSGYVDFLSGAGFNVVGLADGESAVATAVNITPDAVITDVSLPGLDGLGLAAALRTHSRTRDVPVIALTAHRTAEVRARATSAGVTTLLLKPCVPAHLLAELERVLRRRAVDE